jgi:hypothetical protein
LVLKTPFFVGLSRPASQGVVCFWVVCFYLGTSRGGGLAEIKSGFRRFPMVLGRVKFGAALPEQRPPRFARRFGFPRAARTVKTIE